MEQLVAIAEIISGSDVMEPEPNSYSRIIADTMLEVDTLLIQLTHHRQHGPAFFEMVIQLRNMFMDASNYTQLYARCIDDLSKSVVVLQGRSTTAEALRNWW